MQNRNVHLPLRPTDIAGRELFSRPPPAPSNFRRPRTVCRPSTLYPVAWTPRPRRCRNPGIGISVRKWIKRFISSFSHLQRKCMCIKSRKNSLDHWKMWSNCYCRVKFFQINIGGYVNYYEICCLWVRQKLLKLWIRNLDFVLLDIRQNAFLQLLHLVSG